MNGVDTSPAKVAEFAAHYLYSGNASESAKAVGLPDRTGRDIARRLQDDPEFAEKRRLLRKNALDELVAARMRVTALALKRFEEDLQIPEVGEGAIVNIKDARPDYGKLVLDAEKNAHNLAKIESGADPERPGKTEVHVHLKGVDAKPDDQSG